MCSGCTIAHTLVSFWMQEVEELCDTDLEFHFDLKIPSDVHPIDQLSQDHLLPLDAASGIQVGPGHDLVGFLLDRSTGRRPLGRSKGDIRVSFHWTMAKGQSQGLSLCIS